VERTFNLVGRVLLAHIFIISGWSKIGAFAGTEAYMASMGVPGALLPLVIAVELLGGLALVVGFKTRWTALMLAAFSVLAALLFHNNFADQTEMISLMKNFAMAGGLLLLAQTGAASPSVDAARRAHHTRAHAHA
jgi:putative oxidoreductase